MLDLSLNVVYYSSDTVDSDMGVPHSLPLEVTLPHYWSHANRTKVR